MQKYIILSRNRSKIAYFGKIQFQNASQDTTAMRFFCFIFCCINKTKQQCQKKPNSRSPNSIVCLRLIMVTVSEIHIIKVLCQQDFTVCSGAALYVLNVNDLCEIMRLQVAKFSSCSKKFIAVQDKVNKVLIFHQQVN